jgi:benzoyl-CoA reductase subunit B
VSVPSVRARAPPLFEARVRVVAEKQLETTGAAASFQKTWFSRLRQRVFDERQPYALVQADVPFELFDLLDVPAVSNQWWAAIVAAKRQAPAYLDAMEADGMHRGLCRYCSLGLASTRYRSVQEPPWGGLPKPRLLCARLTCDCIHRVFALWAEAFGSELFEIEHPGATELPPRWWELSRHRWRELVEPHRLALVVDNLEGLVGRLEAIAGRRLDRQALVQLLDAVNRQEEIFDEVRTLIASAPKVPVRMTEQIANVMATQWVRGSEWALSHARAFRDEVRARVEAGIAACPNERRRLMWVGAGLWHDTDFYNAFEASHGAVFVWSMYLAFGPDGYIRYGLDDPMAALASRTASFNEYLHNPPWAPEWIVEEARRHRIDAAVVLRPTSMRPAATGRLFIERALERAGVNVLPLEADVVDSRSWDPVAARAAVTTFLDAHPL